jgi:hypothetical protein
MIDRLLVVGLLVDNRSIFDRLMYDYFLLLIGLVADYWWSIIDGQLIGRFIGWLFINSDRFIGRLFVVDWLVGLLVSNWWVDYWWSITSGRFIGRWIRRWIDLLLVVSLFGRLLVNGLVYR